MADYLVSSPSGDQLISPSGDLLSSGWLETYSGNIAMPVMELDGVISLPGPKTFSGDIQIPVIVIAGTQNTAKIFSGNLVLPSPNSQAVLVSSPNDNQLVTSPNDNRLVLDKQYIRGHFETVKNFSGSLTLIAPTLSADVNIIVNTFSGDLVLPIIAIDSEFSNPKSSFAGNLYLPVPTISGSLAAGIATFSGNLIMPIATLRAARKGRVKPYAVIASFSPQPYNNTFIDALIDELTSGSGGLDAFDTLDDLRGDTAGDNDTENRSITIRNPELLNKRALAINPRIQQFMSGKRRSYIETPVTHRISFTWRLMNCTSSYGNYLNLLGVLYFKKVRYVINDDTWELVLLDDAFNVLHDLRSSHTVTLNFEGRKMPLP